MEMNRSLHGLAVSQMSTPITSSTTAQAQTSSTHTHPQFTMANLAQEDLDSPMSTLALGQADSLIEIDDVVDNIVDVTPGPTQLSAALVPSDNANDVDYDAPLDRGNVDNADEISSGWMSDIAERQTAFHIPAVQPQGARVAVDDEIAFHFRGDRSPVAPHAFVYDSCSRQPSRQSSRAPSRRSAMSERFDPMVDLVKQLVDKISVDATRKESDFKAELERQRVDMERQRTDMRREMSLELEVARLRSLVDAQRDASVSVVSASDKRTMESVLNENVSVRPPGGGVRPVSGPPIALRDSGGATAAPSVGAVYTAASGTRGSPPAVSLMYDTPTGGYVSDVSMISAPAASLLVSAPAGSENRVGGMSAAFLRKPSVVIDRVNDDDMSVTASAASVLDRMFVSTAATRAQSPFMIDSVSVSAVSEYEQVIDRRATMSAAVSAYKQLPVMTGMSDGRVSVSTAATQKELSMIDMSCSCSDLSLMLDGALGDGVRKNRF